MFYPKGLYSCAYDVDGLCEYQIMLSSNNKIHFDIYSCNFISVLIFRGVKWLSIHFFVVYVKHMQFTDML